MKNCCDPNFITHDAKIDEVWKASDEHGAILASPLRVALRFASHAQDRIIDRTEELPVEPNFLTPVPRHRCFDVLLS